MYTDQSRRRDDVRAAGRLVLSQHRELRRLLALGLMQVYAWSHGQRSAHGALRALVAQIRAAFIRHVADEEELLLSLPQSGLPTGAERAQTLRALHARQRNELDALCVWPEYGSTDALADRFDVLARVLLTDIAHEERELFLHHGALVTDRDRNADASIASI